MKRESLLRSLIKEGFYLCFNCTLTKIYRDSLKASHATITWKSYLPLKIFPSSIVWLIIRTLNDLKFK